MKFSRRLHLAQIAGLMTASAVSLLETNAYAANQSGVEVPPFPSLNQADKVAYGTSLARYAEEYDSGWIDQYSKGKMTLTDARGDSVQREVMQAILEGKSGDKSIVRFMTPADIRGVAALIHEKPGGTDDSWLYLPASRRVRRISGANRTSSFQGTEFTYEDLSSFTVSRYNFSHESDTTLGSEPVYILKATPRYRDTGYSYMRIFLHRSHFRAEKVDFFDKSGRLLKTLNHSAWNHVHGRFWRPLVQEMHNHQTGKHTRIDTHDLRVNLALYPDSSGKARLGLSESLFTRGALEGS